MGTKRLHEADPRIQQALTELKATIANRWPAARFAISHGDDSEGIYLDATVDLDDPDEVLDLVVDRLLDWQIEEGLPVHVVPLRTAERAAALSHQQRQREPYPASMLETQLHAPI